MTNPEAARRVRFGPLDTIEVPGGPSAPVIICFHGFGANAADLAPLAMDLRLGAPARWIFPDAPLELEFGGFGSGRAWFPIDMEEFQRIQREGSPRNLARSRPEGLDAARKAVRELVAAAGVRWDRLIVGGFSQGSMVALDLLLHERTPPMGLFILSGNLVDEKDVKDRASRLAGLSFFQSHGTSDPLLGLEGAQSLSSILNGAGLKGELRLFEGGHALPPEVLVDLGTYLRKVQE